MKGGCVMNVKWDIEGNWDIAVFNCVNKTTYLSLSGRLSFLRSSSTYKCKQ